MSIKKLITKKEETSTSKTKEDPERHLIEGASLLMKGFKTPSLFLEFLNESLFWVEHFNRDRKVNESVFFIKRMIEETIQPWIKNGPDVTHEITKGLREIHRDSGHEGYLKEVSILLQGFAISCGDSPYFDSNKYLLSFDILYRISFCLNSYEWDLDKIREQEKLSQAA